MSISPIYENHNIVPSFISIGINYQYPHCEKNSITVHRISQQSCIQAPPLMLLLPQSINFYFDIYYWYLFHPSIMNFYTRLMHLVSDFDFCFVCLSSASLMFDAMRYDLHVRSVSKLMNVLELKFAGWGKNRTWNCYHCRVWSTLC